MEIIEIQVKNYEMETPGLKARFKKLGLNTFDSLAFQFKNIEPGTYHVETKHIFSNQYNTAEGFRIFEKCTRLSGPKMKKTQGYYISKGIDKIRAYQNRITACGYCGAQYIDSKQRVCSKCISSEYLKQSELHLLELLPILEKRDRKLTNSELNKLLPKYKEAQGLGKTSREKALLSKNRQKIAALMPNAKEKADKAIEEAKIKTEAYTWLLDHGLNILDNVIYYDHTQRFCFGWRTPLTNDQKTILKEVLCEFLFDYDLN